MAISKYLLDYIIKEAAGILGLDLLLNPPVGGDVGDVSPIGRACTAGEDSNNTTIPRKDNGPRVASSRKLSSRRVIGQDSNLDGGLLNTLREL
ncbi:unnamed protein product [Tuber aestivum]|uniref:Uncharacterized protein n=1 Tax=Tuber aestivum TaxID=59557 RepID=A0A292Q4U2_9PEZI|nr:unnamed protein product [Tuber aestivum]